MPYKIIYKMNLKTKQTYKQYQNVITISSLYWEKWKREREIDKKKKRKKKLEIKF